MAAADLGVQYVGVALNARHAQWLNNTTDRHVWHLISTHVSHFQRLLLDAVKRAEKVQEHEPERNFDILTGRRRTHVRAALASLQSDGSDTVYM